MSWQGPFKGVIRVGDRFTWAPYGHESWPGATCLVEVVDVTSQGGEVWVWAHRTNGAGEITAPDGDPGLFNEESHFREMVGEHRPIAAVSKYPISHISTDSPRKPETKKE